MTTAEFCTRVPMSIYPQCVGDTTLVYSISSCPVSPIKLYDHVLNVEFDDTSNSTTTILCNKFSADVEPCIGCYPEAHGSKSCNNGCNCHNIHRASYPQRKCGTEIASTVENVYMDVPVIRTRGLMSVGDHVCSTQYSEHCIVTSCQGPDNGHITYTKGELIFSGSLLDGSNQFALGPMWRSTSDYVDVIIVFDDNSQIVDRVWVAGETFCILKDAYTAYDLTYAAYCVPRSVKLVWGIPVLLAVVGTIYMWGIIVIGCILCPFRHAYRYIKKSKKANDTNLNEPVKTVYRKRKGTSLSAASLVVLAMAKVCLGSCISGGTITGTATNCQLNPDGTETCLVQTSTEFSIPYSGGSACFTLETPDAKIYNLSVAYLYQEVSVLSQARYYTASRSLVAESVHHCWKAGSCSGSNCEDLDPYQNTDAYGELTRADVISWPGRTRCHRSCGCSSCGCFYCTASCVFSRFALVPQKKVYQVLIPNTFQTIIGLTISLGSGMETRTYNIKASEPSVSYNGVQLSLRNAFAGGSGSLFSGFAFLVDKGTIGTSTPPNTLYALNMGWTDVGVRSWGLIGEIQSSTASSFTSPNKDAFLIPASDPNIVDQDHSATYSAAADAITTYASHFIAFPYTFNGNTWIAKDTVVMTNRTRADVLIGELNLPEGISITRKVETVCPVVTVVNTTGCYNCPLGFSTVIQAKSACSAGLCSLKSTSEVAYYIESSISLTRSDSLFVLHGVSSTRNINLVVTFGTGSYADVVTVIAMLDEFVPDGGTNNGTFTNTTETGWDSIDPWLQKLTIGLSIGAFLIIIFVIGLVLYLVYKALTKPKVKTT